MAKKTKETEDHKEEIPTIDQFGTARRNLSGRVQIVVDTFKLEPETMLKNIGFGGRIKVEPFEHCHIYHTYDSNGRQLKGTNQVGGHYHEVKVYVDEATGDLKGVCSPPLQNKKSEAIVGKDTHTHEVRYIKSEKVELRKMNALAQQYAANYMKEDPEKTKALRGQRVD